MDIEQTSQELKERFAKVNVQLQEKDIAERLTLLVTKFKVPINEARRNVISFFLKEHGIKQDEFFKTSGFSSQEPVKIAALVEDNKWVTFVAKVTVLWEPRHEKIAQTGLLGDETGTIPFTIWNTTDVDELEEGRSYLFKNVVTSSFQGRISIKVNKNSEISPYQGEINVSKKTESFTGAIVDLQAGSGLIKRCPECNRSLSKGSCGEHGRVEGIYDLRIKAVLDDGTATRDLIINRELTEKLTGIPLGQAKEMATEALDQGVVIDRFKSLILGKYYEVAGIKIDKNILVESIVPVGAANLTTQVDVLLATAGV